MKGHFSDSLRAEVFHLGEAHSAGAQVGTFIYSPLPSPTARTSCGPPQACQLWNLFLGTSWKECRPSTPLCEALTVSRGCSRSSAKVPGSPTGLMRNLCDRICVTLEEILDVSLFNKSYRGRSLFHLVLGPGFPGGLLVFSQMHLHCPGVTMACPTDD